MIYLTNVHKRYGSKVLFDKLSWHLRPEDKVGLVGDNGMGKTTLFRIILGLERADSGDVVLRKGARVAMIAQDLESFEESVLERVVTGDAHFKNVREVMGRLEKDERFHERDPEHWSRDYGNAQHEFERLGGYSREAKAKSILGGLGFRQDQWDEPLDRFSGGWRMRVELARLLLQNPDVLLLDEPSNHLDLESVIWLEGFLKSYGGSILLISHDRRFLNGLVDRIVHLDRGTLTVYTGNYDDFERQKRERELHLEQVAANQKRHIDDIERFIERFRAKNTKATQVQSRIKMLEKMARVETATQTKSIDFRFPQPGRFGRATIDLVRVNKHYGSKEVYTDLSLTLERGIKTALVGPNGAGKSTLLKMLAGVVTSDGGEIRLGSNVTRAYYAQHQSEILDDELTVLETMSEISGSMSRAQQQNILGAFRFSGDEVQKKVAVLSGGERARLALAKMLVAPTSVLLLDEPTNHLDMRSRDVLAAALADFEGCLVVISHDRFFLDGFINRVWEVGAGTVREILGSYTDYEWVQARKEAAAEANSLKPRLGKNSKAQKRLKAEERNRRYRELKPLQGMLVALEARLGSVMVEKDQLDRRLAEQEIYQAANKEDLRQVLSRRKELFTEEKGLVEEIEGLTERLKTF